MTVIGCYLGAGKTTLITVMDQIRALRPAPDHVVVEVSGVGDPAAVARWADR